MSSITLKGLSGKVAIVTASTFGIGFSIAQRLAQEGAKVIISSRKEAHVQKAIKSLRDENLDVDGVVCHVSNHSDRERLFKKAQTLGGLDILISNAGANPVPSYVYDCPESAWDKTFDVNVKSSYLLSKEALPLLRKSKAGRIIYISSVSSFYPVGEIGAYSVSKAALCSLAKLGAIQLGRENITVNCVVPGMITTRFSEILYPTKEKEEGWKSVIPLNRFGKPEEISSVVAFLSSDEATYITGENIVVAGGIHTRL